MTSTMDYNSKLNHPKEIFTQREKGQNYFLFSLKNIDSSKKSNIRKIIIIFAYFICFSYFLWQVGTCVNRYQSCPTGVSHVTKEEKVTYLPSVSICSNYHRFRQMLENEKKKNNNKLITELDMKTFWNDNGIEQNKIKIWRTCNKFSTDNLGPDVNITTFNSIIGKCVDITLDCPLFQRHFGMDIEVQEHPKIQKVAGFTNEHAPYYNVYLHLPGELDTRKVFKTNLEGLWKAQLQIVLEKIKTENINSLTNPCISMDEYTKCREKCLIELVEKHAKCKIPTYEAANLRFCNNWDDVFEVYQLYDRWEIIEGKLQNCSCVRPCNEVKFRVGSAMKKYRSTNTLKLEILMDEIGDEVVSEYYTYSLTMLISDLSGIIVLFLVVLLFSLLKIF